MPRRSRGRAAAEASTQAAARRSVRHDAEELERAERVFDRLGAVQVPASPVDQRLRHSPVTARLADVGAEVQVRSVFLQGLLLDPAAGTPLRDHSDVRAFHRFCEERGVDPLAAACRSAGRRGPARRGRGRSSRRSPMRGPPSRSTKIWLTLASDDADLVDPRRWRR